MNSIVITNYRLYYGIDSIQKNLQYTSVPFGLHCTQSAARFSLRITRVGTHSVSSCVQTYLNKIEQGILVKFQVNKLKIV